MPALLLLTGPSSGLRYEIQTEATLGRSSQCEVPLEDGKVSRRHARVELRAGQAFLSDLGSRNGTLINGERVAREVTLKPGDRFQVGDTTVLFETSAREATLDEATQADFDAIPVDQLVPGDGIGGFLVQFTRAALGAMSGPAVLRRGGEQLVQRLNADWVAILIHQPDGLQQVCSVGSGHPVVARPLAMRVLTRGEAVWDGGGLCVPLGTPGGALGVLYLDRKAPLTPDERQLVATGARVLGEMWAHAQPAHQQPSPSLVGSSDTFRATLEQVRKAASGKDNLVLTGETGVGKRTLAESIHGALARSLGPLWLVDCREPVAVVEDLLFGRAPAPGVAPMAAALARADGGTLLLHHVEALGKNVSERLARHVARKTAPGPTGDDVKVDVRIVCTSANPMAQLAPGGQQPLLTALAANEIKVPPLRDRSADVPDLFTHFANGVVSRLKKPAPSLTAEAVDLMTTYKWPLNVEELKLVAERVAGLLPGEEIPSYRLPPELQKMAGGAANPTLQAMIERLERDVISEALVQAKGKKIKAAALLDISRPTLDKKIEDYQLKVEKVRDE